MPSKFLTLISFLAISLPCLAQNGAIEGMITNQKNKPIHGTVKLIGRNLFYTVTTDRHGRYLINDIVPGTYEAEADPNIYDYRDWKGSVKIEAGKTAQLYIRLLPKILNNRK